MIKLRALAIGGVLSCLIVTAPPGACGEGTNVAISSGPERVESLAEYRIAIQPVEPVDGIRTGRVVAYGHPLRPPFKFEIRDDVIYVNAVQVSPSLIAVQRAKKVPPLKDDDKSRLHQAMRLSERAESKFRRARKAGQTTEDAEQVVIQYLRSDPLVDKVVLNGSRDVSFSVRREGRHSMWFGITLIDREPLQESAKNQTERETQYERGRREQVQRMEAELRSGAWLYVDDDGGTGRIEDAPESIIAIMENGALPQKARISGIERLLRHKHRHQALEIIANYSRSSWEQPAE